MTHDSHDFVDLKIAFSLDQWKRGAWSLRRIDAGGPAYGSMAHRLWHFLAPDSFAEAWPVQALQWSNKSPLWISASYSRYDCMSLWLEYCNPMDLDPKTGLTILMKACSVGRSSTIRWLLRDARVQANLNMTDKKGRNALGIALSEGAWHCARLLAEQPSIDPHALVWQKKEQRWVSPLSLAWRQSDWELIEALVKPPSGSSSSVATWKDFDPDGVLWREVQDVVDALVELRDPAGPAASEIRQDWVLDRDDVDHLWQCIEVLCTIASDEQMEAIFPLAPLEWAPQRRAHWEREQMRKAVATRVSTPGVDADAKGGAQVKRPEAQESPKTIERENSEEQTSVATPSLSNKRGAGVRRL